MNTANEKKCIDLEPLAETQNMVDNTKQQHMILNEQQRESQQVDLNKGFFTIYTNSEPLQKTFQSCNLDSHAKKLHSLKKKSLKGRSQTSKTHANEKQRKQYFDT